MAHGESLRPARSASSALARCPRLGHPSIAFGLCAGRSIASVWLLASVRFSPSTCRQHHHAHRFVEASPPTVPKSVRACVTVSVQRQNCVAVALSVWSCGFVGPSSMPLLIVPLVRRACGVCLQLSSCIGLARSGRAHRCWWHGGKCGEIDAAVWCLEQAVKSQRNTPPAKLIVPTAPWQSKSVSMTTSESPTSKMTHMNWVLAMVIQPSHG